MLSQAGDRLVIRHPIEIYAETLAGPKPGCTKTGE